VRLLALDTATEYCSAAIWNDGEVTQREAAAAQAASAQVLDLVAACLGATGIALEALDAIAFGRGPGGFTGVRMAASVAQGLAFAAGLPVLPVSTLRAVAQHAVERTPAARQVLVCQDARMSEVYWAPFEVRAAIAVPAGVERVDRPALVSLPDGWMAQQVIGAGSGFDVYPELAQWSIPLPACHSQASLVARLAAHDGLASAVSAEQALPVYLRNNVAVPSQLER
jgi:tRNA threonylcarbamoyladenosine biosynthesis protein TsaB